MAETTDTARSLDPSVLRTSRKTSDAFCSSPFLHMASARAILDGISEGSTSRIRRQSAIADS